MRAESLTADREPQVIATIIVEGKKFNIYKALLVEDSKYFERALNGSFVEGATQTIEMGDDVTVQEFGIYVDALHRNFFIKNFQFRPIINPKVSRFTQCLALWKLSDRFLNQQMQSIAQEALEFHADAHSKANWEKWYQDPKWSDPSLRSAVLILQDAFQLCEESNIPWQDTFIECASNIPVQLFTKLHDELDIKCRTAVMKKILKRFEIPSLKRPAPADAECEKSSVKKQYLYFDSDAEF